MAKSDAMDVEYEVMFGGSSGGSRPTYEAATLSERLRSTADRLRTHIVHLLSNLLGDDVFGRTARSSLLRAAGANIGPLARMHGGTYVSNPANLTMGYHARLNRNCYLDLHAPIVFKDYAGVGHGVTFMTTIHDVCPGMNVGIGMHAEPITIGERAWIGSNATVMPGVTIGSDAIVAVGAVVVKDVLPNTLVAGSPARMVRKDVRDWVTEATERHEAEASRATGLLAAEQA
jgi:acetyltransferase-like isoleucine patch superfamily enzyme